MGDDDLSWRQLDIFIGGCQLDSSTALYKVMNPDHRWDLSEQLLAHVADTLAAGNWQRAGKKSAPKPKPIKRPGVSSEETTTLGTTVMSVAEADEWLSGDAQIITPTAANEI
ncbi:hypothetical protein C5E10_18030 [Pseudoclavibacter sp. RFBG4]|uniref:hypothetical protein n=1 Tax=Pseudoclavibacter sp. RFBG4 TaxID=2080575 RepID=UPI000CE81A16|nr:hypothetical protein [Pseudoclavibacter sp. RFBG4]PPG25969.1 hypothetical protein C5E10_18030 [Pseudoclavibacter sp. RFBG4]